MLSLRIRKVHCTMKWNNCFKFNKRFSLSSPYPLLTAWIIAQLWALFWFCVIHRSIVHRVCQISVPKQDILDAMHCCKYLYINSFKASKERDSIISLWLLFSAAPITSKQDLNRMTWRYVMPGDFYGNKRCAWFFFFFTNSLGHAGKFYKLPWVSSWSFLHPSITL